MHNSRPGYSPNLLPTIKKSTLMKLKETPTKNPYASKEAGNHINMYSILQFEPNPQIMTDILRIKQEQKRRYSSFHWLKQERWIAVQIKYLRISSYLQGSKNYLNYNSIKIQYITQGDICVKLCHQQANQNLLAILHQCKHCTLLFASVCCCP